MKNIILFEDDLRDHFLPIVYNKPLGAIRIGIHTIQEKWQYYAQNQVSFITQEYLSEAFPIFIDDDNYLINARLLPNDKITRLIDQLDFNESLMYKDQLLAIRLNGKNFKNLLHDVDDVSQLHGIEVRNTPFNMISSLSDIYTINHDEIAQDFALLTEGRTSEKLHESNTVIGDKSRIFIEKGAEVYASSINVTDGPVYIGGDAKIMEGSMIRGSLALCDHATIKMGAKVYGGTTIGAHCKIGGEVNNSIFMDYSNKGHDGFIGNSIIGSWCNLGADTNCSNLKNNYSNVRQWQYPRKSYVDTGKQFVGLVMADFSKCGINSMFNTGTVVGISSNIFGGGFPDKFVPSFSFGGAQHGWQTNDFEKSIFAINAMMERRGRTLTESEIEVLAYIHEISSLYRKSTH